MMRSFILLVAIFLGCSHSLYAQPLRGSSNYEQLIAKAELEAQSHNYYGALEAYESAFEKKEVDSLIAHIAYYNYQLRDYKAANRNYRKLFRRVEVSDATHNDHRLYYGRSLKSDGEYDDAITVLQAYLQHVEDPAMRDRARLEILGAELGQNMPDPEEATGVQIELLDRKINSSNGEYSPAMSDENTLYWSTWKSNQAADLMAMNDEANVSQIFMSTKDEEGDWQRPEALGVEVNRPEVHTANPAISPDGRRLYFNRLILEGQRPSDARIYLSDVDDTGWKSGNEVTGLGGGDYLALQPNVGELFGQEVLFFVSDMPGGYGGYDIYYAPHEGEGVYGTPINLGEQVNTAGDDMTPFFFDGTLYLATDGRPSIGGLDLYYTVWDGSQWSDPQHMGAGFNSPADDMSLKLYGEGYVGFLTSNREGGRSIKSRTCCDDIYGFEIDRVVADLVVGLFSEDREGLLGGEVRLEPLVNNEIVPGGDTQSKDSGNRYDFGLALEYDYMVIGSHPDYFPDTFYFDTKSLSESRTTTHRFYLKAKPQPPAQPLYDTIAIEKAIVLENILFDFNKSNIRPEAEEDLRKLQGLMEQYPDMEIELGSHTDVRGQDSYNQRLSERRAQSTKRWLIQQGIASNRMTAVGFGETVPKVVAERTAARYDWLNVGDVLTENFIDALPADLQEQAHELNRRTEFRITAGPTSIVVDYDYFERKDSSDEKAPNRNANPGTGSIDLSPSAPSRSTTAAPEPTQTNWPPAISHLSSLNGQKELDEVPILIFDKREVELGTVKKGDTREMVFHFTNRGKVPAQIMLIQACDCTTTEHNNLTVYQPGESGTIRAVFDSSSKSESETIGIDIFLEQTDAGDVPIVEELKYSFEIE